MKDIKFRAWDKENQEMIYSDKEYIDYQFVINSNSVACINIEDYDDSFGYTQTSSCELDNMMQYTGLKDKNGKKIYEGDILKVRHFTPNDISKPAIWYEQRVIKYFEELAQFVAVNRENKDDYIMNELSEVIGNIHENPELLEVN